MLPANVQRDAQSIEVMRRQMGVELDRIFRDLERQERVGGEGEDGEGGGEDGEGEGEGEDREGEDALPSDGGWWDGEEHGSSEWGLTDGDSMSASEGEMVLGERPSGMPLSLLFRFVIVLMLGSTSSITDADVQVRLTQDGNYTVDDGASVPKA